MLEDLPVLVKTEAAALALTYDPVTRGGARPSGFTFGRNSHTAQKADVFSSYRRKAEQGGPITLQPNWAILFYSLGDGPEIYPMKLNLP